VVLFVFGWAIYRTVIFRVVDKDLFISILATFGLSILLQQLANELFGADVRTAEAGFGTRFLFGGSVTVADIKLIAFAAALAVGAALMVFLKRSRMGQAIRATDAGFVFGSEYQAAFVFGLMVLILVWRRFWLARERRYLR
jgi:branched-chain amino acid transport system permease protein